MFALKTKLRDVCVAHAPLANLLNVVPGTTRKAVYINHLSQYQEVYYPAISFFLDTGGADQDVLFADDFQIQVDAWTNETQQRPGYAYLLSGAHQILDAFKALTHQAQFSGRLKTAAYALVRFAEISGAKAEDFEPDQKLFHVSTRYRVRLIPLDADLTTPN